MKNLLSLILLITTYNFAFQPEIVQKEIYKCTEDTSVYIKINYPQIINLGNLEVQNKINAFLESEFTKALESYNEFISDPELLEYYPADWVFSFEVSFRTTYLSNELLSIVLDHIEFTGGAHHNYFSTGYNIRLSDGQLLKLDDIIKQNQFFNLSLFCEEEILKIYNASSLAEAGFFDDEIIITPNQDFYVKPNYLVIQFDPYEIAPYSLGSIEIELRFDRLKLLLKPDILFITNE
ncbi:MAG: DUF3298 and DUF4163 domain-containing protein [Ignavibacterium sp.]|nr:DUF3298 and DUF4163 domain-containing protein [Ignavibacterium sp.]MDW8375691.1 DUF3298 and DUF4163 domain-containing protein [Ignavibacteriales bacterium]